MKPTPFGRYLLLDKVASGGMAEVWRAKLVGESGFQRIVAIKKILPHVSEDQEFITMFTDEAKITVQLQHSNIGQVYEFDKIDGIFYIAMEYISGKDLKTLWSFQRSRKATLPIDLACLIVKEMAEGLDYSHRKKDNFGNDLGIVHRDVSPQNCLISWDGEVKVIDFGIAKAADKAGHTRAGTLKGKFAYMSPEQIRGLPLDGRADVFALGVVLYELVTSERGFQAESEFSLLEMVRNVEIKPPTMVNREIPQELERIIFKALAKDRDHRYRWGSDLSEDLQRFLLNRGKPPTRHDLGKFLRENFTVDYDKERLRLESYKEVQWERPPPELAPSPAATAPIVPDVPEAAVTAVQAAMMLDDLVPGMGATGTYTPKPRGGQTNARAPNPHASQRTSARNSVQEGTGTGYSLQSNNVDENTANRTPTRAPAQFAPSLRAAPKPPVPVASSTSMKKLALAAVGGVAMVGVAALVLLVVLGAKKGTVTITVLGTPEASVLLDGDDVGVATPSLTIPEVSAGAHDIIVQKEKFKAWHRTITMEGGKVVALTANLEQAPGRFTLSTEPPGAQVFLNGEDTTQKTPTTLDVPAEMNHSITFKMTGFHDETKTERVTPSESREVALRLRPQSVKVEIATVPSGADVKLSGSSVGKSPFKFQWDPSMGYPKVTISKKGCKTVETSIALENDRAEQKFVNTLECK
jgi:serine/threonine protein kinase